MKAIFCSIILMSYYVTFSQNLTVSGTVVDEKKNVIAHASVTVVGTNISDNTDDEGQFVLTMYSSQKKGDLITIRVEKNGFNTSTRKISISDLPLAVTLRNSSSTPKPKEQNVKSIKRTARFESSKSDPPSTVIVGKPSIEKDRGTSNLAGEIKVTYIKGNTFLLKNLVANDYNSFRLDGYYFYRPGKEPVNYDTYLSMYVDDVETPLYAKLNKETERLQLVEDRIIIYTDKTSCLIQFAIKHEYQSGPAFNVTYTDSYIFPKGFTLTKE
jgi:hypothetical protein